MTVSVVELVSERPAAMASLASARLLRRVKVRAKLVKA